MRLPRSLRIPRKPDFLIGGAERPYLRRWWVIPRNRFFNIYLHNILRSDDDRALHDHPWWSISIILRGGYYEWRPGYEYGTQLGMMWRRPGCIRFRKATDAHRLELEIEPCDYHGGWKAGEQQAVECEEYKVRPCWTLFITGPRVRDWGFHCPKGWVPWQEFTDPTDSGRVGKGCGE